MKNASNENISAEKSLGYRVLTIVRKILIYLFSFFIIIAAMFFAADKSPNKSLFGYRYYIVLTDSMKPEFSSGDVVFVKRANAGSIDKGDIITFDLSSESDAYLTHRVTEKIENYKGTGVTCFRTKGDANNSEDSFLIDESRVIGKVKFHIPKLGFIIRFAQLRWYFILAIIILMILFFKLMKYYFTLLDEKQQVTAKSIQKEPDDAENTREDTEGDTQADTQGDSDGSQKESAETIDDADDRTEV